MSAPASPPNKKPSLSPRERLATIGLGSFVPVFCALLTIGPLWSRSARIPAELLMLMAGPIAAALAFYSMSVWIPSLAPSRRMTSVLAFTIPLVHAGLVLAISALFVTRPNPLMEPIKIQQLVAVWMVRPIYLCVTVALGWLLLGISAAVSHALPHE